MNYVENNHQPSSIEERAVLTVLVGTLCYI